MAGTIDVYLPALPAFATGLAPHATAVAQQSTFGSGTINPGRDFVEAADLVRKNTAALNGMRSLLAQIHGGIVTAQDNAGTVYQGYRGTDTFHASDIGRLETELDQLAGA